MKNNTKIILVVVVVILAWAILSGNIDVGNLFSSVPSAPASSSSSSGGIAILVP